MSTVEARGLLGSCKVSGLWVQELRLMVGGSGFRDLGRGPEVTIDIDLGLFFWLSCRYLQT